MLDPKNADIIINALANEINDLKHQLHCKTLTINDYAERNEQLRSQNDKLTNATNSGDFLTNLKEGKKIQAIKGIRSVFNLDLRTSKDIVDWLDMKLHPLPF